MYYMQILETCVNLEKFLSFSMYSNFTYVHLVHIMLNYVCSLLQN